VDVETEFLWVKLMAREKTPVAVAFVGMRQFIFLVSIGRSAKLQMAVRLLVLGEYNINTRDEMSFIA
jgi:hypothetical protein